MGRWTRFYGGYHSTKTLTALSSIREAQNMGLLCAYYNVEKQYDVDFARDNIGLDPKELTLVEGATHRGDRREDGVDDAGVSPVHVIDSCSIAVSEDELNADIRDWRPGISARAWGKVFKRLNDRFDQLGNTVILIDQVRVNFKTQGEVAAGGSVFDHQSSMSMLFKKGQWIGRNKNGFLDGKAKENLDKMIEPAGYEVKCRVEKSRVCRPFRTGIMRFDVDNLAFDRIWELKVQALRSGVIRQGGAYYTYVPKDGDEVKIGQGDKACREFIASDLTLQEEIRERSMAMVGR